MRRGLSLTTLAVAIAIAISAPITVALYSLYLEGRRSEAEVVETFASDVLHRSESIWAQVDAAFDALLPITPCSPEQRTIMRRLDLGSTYLQAVGRVEGTRLVCSSLDLAGKPLELGPVTVEESDGTRIRTNVSLEFAAEPLLVVEREGYAAIVNKGIPTDSALAIPGSTLAAILTHNGVVVASRGHVDPSWVRPESVGKPGYFRRDGRVIAVALSELYPLAGLAAVPDHRVPSRMVGYSLLIVPVVVGAAGLMIIALLMVVRQRRSMASLIRSGLRRDEFSLVYQPIVDLRTGIWVGAEALLRWTPRAGGTVSPDVFIPAAEASGLIRQLTERVVDLMGREAFDVFSRLPGFHLAINLSSEDLHSDRIVNLMARLAKATAAGPGNLVVEATERSLIDVGRAAPVVKRLRADGVVVAIDDFGTGYSNLAELERWEVDCLKIDRSFVESIDTGAATSRVVTAIIEMARSRGLQLVAEGVEREDQRDYLAARGVQFGQGWLFARAMPFGELMRQVELAGQAVGSAAAH